MTPRELFEREVATYGTGAGRPAVERMYLVLARVVRWTRQQGHGSCILNAVDHSLGNKIKTTTIEDVNGK